MSEVTSTSSLLAHAFEGSLLLLHSTEDDLKLCQKTSGGLRGCMGQQFHVEQPWEELVSDMQARLPDDEQQSAVAPSRTQAVPTLCCQKL